MHNQLAQQVEERSFNPRLRKGDWDLNAPPEDRPPPSRPWGGIRISEGCETRLAQGDATTSKGKGKVMMSSGNTLSREKTDVPPSLEALMSNLSLFDEPLLKDLDEEVLTLLSEVHGKEAIKGVQKFMKDAIPFNMMTFVSTFPICCLLSMDIPFICYMLYFVILTNEHVQHLYGEVQRHMTTPAKPPVSSKGGSLRVVHRN